MEPRQYGHQWAKKIGRICNGVTLLNRVFLQENLRLFCQSAKKSGRNNEVTVLVAVRRGFTVLTKDSTNKD